MTLDRQLLKYAVAPSLAVFCSIALAGPVRAEALELVCIFAGTQQHISIDLTQKRVLISSPDATGGPYSASISDKYVRWTILAQDADSLEQRYTIDRVAGTVTYDRFWHGAPNRVFDRFEPLTQFGAPWVCRFPFDCIAQHFDQRQQRLRARHPAVGGGWRGFGMLPLGNVSSTLSRRENA
jgi:hypothetical protein